MASKEVIEPENHRKIIQKYSVRAVKNDLTRLEKTFKELVDRLSDIEVMSKREVAKLKRDFSAIGKKIRKL
jgi:hypothetical protein